MAAANASILFEGRSICCDIDPTNGAQFARQARNWARAHDLPFRLDASRGKGGHQTVGVGDRFTVVKTGEIGTWLLQAMLKQLGIPKDDF